MRADKSCGLHISQFTLACVATKLRLLYRPLEAVIIMYNQGSRLDDPNCELWDFGTSTIEAVLWEQHKQLLETSREMWRVRPVKNVFL